MESAEQQPAQSRLPKIATILRQLGRLIPEEELRAVPKDLAGQADHYVYGTPKREPDARPCGDPSLAA